MSGERKKVRLITDGSCLGNPGPGGWAAILKYNGRVKELTGHAPDTTNNQMELTAAIEGLRALKEPCEVEIKTDSEYVRNGITAWLEGWKRKGWRTSAGSAVKNKELWQALDEQNTRHKTRWVWTKGHAEDPENNRCDELAQAAARREPPPV
jgi:ribonuclease HI